jgi:PPOX class probable F420-dependent enzyme
MRKGLAIEDLGDLVELPLVAVLATYRRDGTVLLSPVWHEWRDQGFDVVTGTHNVRAAHLRRDPSASLVVCDDAPPYRGIEVRAIAQLRTTGVEEVVKRIASRYLGPEAGAAYAKKGRVTTSSSASHRALFVPGTSLTSSGGTARLTSPRLFG